MSVQVIMDGVSYRLNVRYETLGRSFRLEEGQNAGTMLSGDYTRDLMGTYYDYSMEVEPDITMDPLKSAAAAVVAASVAGVSVELPFSAAAAVVEAAVVSSALAPHPLIRPVAITSVKSIASAFFIMKSPSFFYPFCCCNDSVAFLLQ